MKKKNKIKSGIKDVDNKEIYINDTVDIYVYIPPGIWNSIDKPTWEKVDRRIVKIHKKYNFLNIYVWVIEGEELAYKYRNDCLREYDVDNAYRFKKIKTKNEEQKEGV